MTRKRLSADFTPSMDPASAIAELIAATSEFAAEASLAPGEHERLAIIVEELASNAARHGSGARRMTVDLAAGKAAIEIVAEDDGTYFDPTSRKPFTGPDPVTGGGVGLELVRAWCEPLSYARAGGTNRLTMRLRKSPR